MPQISSLRCAATTAHPKEMHFVIKLKWDGGELMDSLEPDTRYTRGTHAYASRDSCVRMVGATKSRWPSSSHSHAEWRVDESLAEILKSPRFRKVYYGALRVTRLGISACSPPDPGPRRWSLHPAESQRSRPWFTDLLIFDESLSPNKEDRGSLAINFPPRCREARRLRYLNRVSPRAPFLAARTITSVLLTRRKRSFSHDI